MSMPLCGPLPLNANGTCEWLLASRKWRSGRMSLCDMLYSMRLCFSRLEQESLLPGLRSEQPYWRRLVGAACNQQPAKSWGPQSYSPRKWILPTSQMSLDTNSAPLEPPGENTALSGAWWDPEQKTQLSCAQPSDSWKLWLVLLANVMVMCYAAIENEQVVC